MYQCFYTNAMWILQKKQKSPYIENKALRLKYDSI